MSVTANSCKNSPVINEKPEDIIRKKSQKPAEPENSDAQDNTIRPTPDQLITLLQIYQSEWEHRDQMLWSQVFKYFYASLIVTVLPYATNHLGVTLPDMDNRYFPLLGVVMGFVFLYVGLGYVYRLKAIGDTYKRLNDMFDPQYRRDSITDQEKFPLGHYFRARMSTILVIVMFLAIESVAFFLLAYSV